MICEGYCLELLAISTGSAVKGERKQSEYWFSCLEIQIEMN
jgi:hypothetical protein